VQALYGLPAGALAALRGLFIGGNGTPGLREFVFRVAAGTILGLVFLIRGFGIAAWTHAICDHCILCFAAAHSGSLSAHADLCLGCGERFYSIADAARFEKARRRLAREAKQQSSPASLAPKSAMDTRGAKLPGRRACSRRSFGV
jgi:hypothetical protein